LPVPQREERREKREERREKSGEPRSDGALLSTVEGFEACDGRDLRAL
jgi:hypothetical protein